MVRFAPTQWGRWCKEAGVRRGRHWVELGDETWRHVDMQIASGGCDVFTCVRAKTQSVLELILFFQRRRGQSDLPPLPLENARRLAHQHCRGTGRLSDEAIESYVAGLLERASVGHMKRAAVSAAWGGAVRDALRRTAWE